MGYRLSPTTMASALLLPPPYTGSYSIGLEEEIPLDQPTTNLYSAFEGQTSPFGTVTDGQPINVGTEFYVTSECQVTAVRFFRGATDLTPDNVRIYRISDSAVIAENSSPGTFSGTGWMEASVPATTLVPNTRYRAAIHTSARFQIDANWWTNPPGSTGVTDGPLVVPNPANSTGGTTNNSTYAYGAIAHPTTKGVSSSFYWVDVVVSVTTHPGSVNLNVTPTLTSDGTVGAGSTTHQGAVSLSSISSLSAAGVRETAGAVSLGVSSSLSASANLTQQAAVTLPVATSLTANGVRLVSGAASLTTAQALSAVGQVSVPGAANLAASTSLVVGALLPGGSAVLAVAGTLAVSGVRTTTSAVSLAVASNLTLQPFVVNFSSTNLNATYTLSVSGIRTTSGAVSLLSSQSLLASIGGAGGSTSLVATAALSVTSVQTFAATVSLQSSSSLSVTGIRTTFGLTSLIASATLNSTAGVGALAAVSASAIGVLSILGRVTAFGVVGLSVLSQLTAGIAGAGGSVNLTSNVILVSDGTRWKIGTANLTAQGTIVVSGFVGGFGTVALSASGGLVVAGRVGHFGIILLFVDGQLDVGLGVISRPGSISLLAQGNISLTSTYIIAATVALSALAELNFIEIFPHVGFAPVTSAWENDGIYVDYRSPSRPAYENGWVTAGTRAGSARSWS